MLKAGTPFVLTNDINLGGYTEQFNTVTFGYIMSLRWEVSTGSGLSLISV